MDVTVLQIVEQIVEAVEMISRRVCVATRSLAHRRRSYSAVH